jgi:hypothetical protein
VGGQSARIVLQAMRDVRVALGKHGFGAAMVPAQRDVEGATVHDGFPQAFLWLMSEVSSAAVAGPRDLYHGQSAVDVQGLPGDIAGLVGGEECRSSGDIEHAAEAICGYAGQDRVVSGSVVVHACHRY